MKERIALILGAVMMLTGSVSAAASENQNLVIYFSRTGEQYTVGVIDKGNTAIIAEMIAEETGGTYRCS